MRKLNFGVAHSRINMFVVFDLLVALYPAWILLFREVISAAFNQWHMPCDPRAENAVCSTLQAYIVASNLLVTSCCPFLMPHSYLLAVHASLPQLL